ncbi:uncharacterized protein DS421_6g184990 [Arachis hypogaea]|nr:uncharacterized protein DS421_6g184990 [Arachis hypogaea]
MLLLRGGIRTHIFHFLVGECTVTLEDVALILDLPINGMPVTGVTLSSHEALEAECLHHFGAMPSGVTGTVEVDAIDILVFLTLGRHLMIFRKARFVLNKGVYAYAVDRIELDTIPPEIYMDSIVWSATVPLVSFECIEWHATDRIRRQFSFIQVVPHQERSLDLAHGEVLTGPKNLDWTTTPTHSFWVMQWTNRYNHILTENLVAPHHPLEIYMDWYRKKYGNHLNLSDLVVQENDDGNSVREDDPQEQENDEPQSPPPQPQPP